MTRIYIPELQGVLSLTPIYIYTQGGTDDPNMHPFIR